LTHKIYFEQKLYKIMFLCKTANRLIQLYLIGQHVKVKKLKLYYITFLKHNIIKLFNFIKKF